MSETLGAATLRDRLRRFVPLAGGTGFDQVLSSLSNFLVSIALARGGDARALGEFTLVFSVYVFALALQRALITEPLLSIPGLRGEGDGHDRGAHGAVLVLSGVVATVLALAGLALHMAGLVVLAALYVPLSSQDFHRYRSFRHGRPSRAVRMDGWWALVALLAWPVVGAGGSVVAVAVWGLAGASGLPFGTPGQARPRRPRTAIAWWRREARGLGGSLAIARIALAGGQQVSVVGIAAILGEAALGGLRAAQLLVAPILLSMIAINYIVIPQLARRESRITARDAWVISGAAVGVSAALAGTAWVLREPLYALVFSGAVPIEPVVVAAVLVKIVVDAAALGLTITLKALRTGRSIAVTSCVSTVLAAPVVLAAAARYGIEGAAIALTLQPALFLVGVALGWRGELARRSAHERGVDDVR